MRLLFSGAVVDAKDHLGITPLFSAASHGHVDIADLLLEHGKFLYMVFLAQVD